MSFFNLKEKPPLILQPVPERRVADILTMPQFVGRPPKNVHSATPEGTESVELGAQLFRRAARKALDHEEGFNRNGLFHSIEMPATSPAADMRASARRLLNMIKTEMLVTRGASNDSRHHAGISVIYRKGETGDISSFETPLHFNRDGHVSNIDSAYRTLDREFMARLRRSDRSPTSGAA